MRSGFSRREFLRTAVLGSAGFALNAQLRANAARTSDKPNLLVFLPDGLRADAVVANAAGAVHAPNIHQLAARSVVFERAYITQPICAPSRSSLLTGMWPHQTGCTNNSGVLPRSLLCLPEMLKDSDYTCGYFGKWHLGDEFLPQHGFTEWSSIVESFKKTSRERGLARWLDHLESPQASDYTRFLASKGYKPDDHNGRYFSDEAAAKMPFELSKAKFVEARATEFLDRHATSPFVMFVAFYEPHPPYYGPFNNEHPFDTVQLDSTANEIFGSDIPLRYRLFQEYYRQKLGGPDSYRRTKQRYFGLITEIDRCIGSVLQKIDTLGIAERTIVVLTSDHGDMMSAHGMLGKQLMFEQSSSVPYVILLPGAGPRRLSQPVSHIDFSPTMLDLLGKPAHSQCIGKSTAAAIRGGSESSEPIFVEWAPEKQKTIRNKTKLASSEQVREAFAESTRAIFTPDGWKLSLRDKDKNELYNLNDDPEERRNLFADAAHRDVVDRLTAQIHSWQERTADKVKV